MLIKKGDKNNFPENQKTTSINMANKKKKFKRRRPLDRAALYNNKPVPKIDKTQESIMKCITKAEGDKTVKESRIRYLDNIIKEMDGLIVSEEPRIAVVSPSGESLAMLHAIVSTIGL